MRGVVHRRAGVDQDIADTANYMREQDAGDDVAERFVANAKLTLRRLAKQPFTGAPRSHSNPKLKGLRISLVEEFEKYVIYYLPVSDGISVLAVWHGARDAHRHLLKRV